MTKKRILVVSDPAIVGCHAGTILLVSRFGKNAIKEIDYACQRFAQNSMAIKGVVFNLFFWRGLA
jgi:tyrosine-protein kinase Etk/Wzc